MTWDKRFWVQPQSFYRIKSVHWWKFLFKNVTENHNSGPKINKNPTENRQKNDIGVGFSIFLCRFLSVLKNRQKPTKSCRFSDTKPTSILSVAILGVDSTVRHRNGKKNLNWISPPLWPKYDVLTRISHHPPGDGTQLKITHPRRSYNAPKSSRADNLFTQNAQSAF